MTQSWFNGTPKDMQDLTTAILTQWAAQFAATQAEVITLRTRISTLERERDEGQKTLAEIHARASDVCKKYHAVSGNHGPRMAYALALHDIATLAHPTIAEETKS